MSDTLPPSLLPETSLLQNIEDGIDTKLAKLISSHATQSEKTSWKRKLANLEALIEKEVNPLNEEISKLTSYLDTALQQVATVRQEMVDTCIHPAEHLAVQKDGSVECKFCMKRMKVIVRDNTN